MKAVKRVVLVAMVLMTFVGCKKKDGGPDVSKLSEAEIRTELTKVIGSTKAWNPEILANVKKGMGYDELAKQFPGLAKPDEWGFSEGVVKNVPLVSEVEFDLEENKVSRATLKFNSTLKKDLFKKLAKESMVTKWGKEAGDEDGIVTWVNDDYSTVQLSFDVLDERWEIDIDIN